MKDNRHMLKRFMLWTMVIALVAVMMGGVAAQEPEPFIWGDMRPDAPELAARGDYVVGVRTIEVVNPDQLDIGNFVDAETSRYDRSLTLEIWYPADAEPGIATYDEVLGTAGDPDNLARPFTFEGRAVRDADPLLTDAPYPLIVVAHGFLGSRLQLTYLNENLASKGYVVVAIDHTGSSFATGGDSRIALYYRGIDIEFVLDEMEGMGAADSESFLSGMVDASQTGLIGFSFGGYGVLNVLGAGVNAITVNLGGVPDQQLAVRQEGNEIYEAGRGDPRIRAVVLFAPYGGDLTFAGFPRLSFWDDGAFDDVTVPSLWVVGTEDRVAFFEGVMKIFNQTVNSDRYLLVYENASHNIAAHPAPPEAVTLRDYERYADLAWDVTRLNNINQHFVTAFFGWHLKGMDAYQDYLDVDVPVSNEAIYTLDDAGQPDADSTAWLGFPYLVTIPAGLQLHHAESGETVEIIE